MIYSDADIRWGRDNGDFTIHPWLDSAVQPASYEVGLTWDGGGTTGDPNHHASQLTLRPGEFRLAHTIEFVFLSNRVCAQLTGKSSLGRLGLLVHATAGFIDPGFRGVIVLELKNLSEHDIGLHHGQPVAQLVFHALRSEAERPYGTPGLGSHYQDQTGDRRSYLDYSAVDW